MMLYSVTALSRINVFHAFGIFFLIFIISALIVVIDAIRNPDPPDYF